jgi:pyruvate,orthophosphate dikinase
MLGHRGCRLGISYPEITEMQARAIFEAAAQVLQAEEADQGEAGSHDSAGWVQNELKNQAEIVHRVAKEVMAKPRE